MDKQIDVYFMESFTHPVADCSFFLEVFSLEF